MSLFKKKNQQEEAEGNNESTFDFKGALLEALNEKLKGNIFDECLILPRGFTIDVQIGKQGKNEDIIMLQAVFLVRHDDFDEPLIEPVDAQGKTEDEAVKMAANAG